MLRKLQSTCTCPLGGIRRIRVGLTSRAQELTVRWEYLFVFSSTSGLLQLTVLSPHHTPSIPVDKARLPRSNDSTATKDFAHLGLTPGNRVDGLERMRPCKPPNAGEVGSCRAHSRQRCSSEGLDSNGIWDARMSEVDVGFCPSKVKVMDG